MLIGALPTYQQVGVWAGILLVIVRVVQGLAFGAEWGGAILMTFEHAPWRKKGLYTGLTQAGFPVGLLLANFAFLISVPLGEQWAWRVPFLLSAVLIVVGIFIRLKVEESPEFEELKEEGDLSKNPLKEVLRDDWKNIVRAFCLRIAETAGYAVSVTFMLSYIAEEKLAGVGHPDRHDDRGRDRHLRDDFFGAGPTRSAAARCTSWAPRSWSCGASRCSSRSTPAPRC